MSDFFNLEPKIFLKKGISKPARIPGRYPQILDTYSILNINN